MNVLLIGSGGREHALAWKLSQSPLLKKLYAAPGSAAIARHAELAALDPLDGAKLAAFGGEKDISLAVIGPEAPLAAGVANALRSAGIKVFGPGREAARLESSKAFAKEFMRRHGVPTARHELISRPSEAAAALGRWRGPVVVKADGLASGKGVRVCGSAAEARATVLEFVDRGPVLLEERLEGPELTVMALCDGKALRLFPASRDHKRLGDGDAGPNTGGMGAFAPVALAASVLEDIQRSVLDRTLKGLQAEGLDYRGALYAGLMLTAEGPKVLEYNCRFGDPETQAVLPLLRSDLLEALLACADGRLADLVLAFEPGACVCVTLASEGYPDRPVLGRPISGLERIPADAPDLWAFHAGTARKGGSWVTAGGRVLGVTAHGRDLAAARRRAYEAAELVSFAGRHFRRDIAAQAAPARV